MRKTGLIWLMVLMAFSVVFGINYDKPAGSHNSDGVLDRITGGTRVITTDHSMLHEKMAYSVYLDSNGLAASDSLSFAFVTPAAPTYVHFKRYETFATAARATFTIKENPGCVSCTTGHPTLAVINRHRVGTPTASAVVVYKNPKGISAGTVIETAATGGGGTGSGSIANTRPMDIEFVLKPATTYIVKIVNNDAQAKDIAIWVYWYEEGNQ